MTPATTPGPMVVSTMPNGQPCVRLPRGLVATMEAGYGQTREEDAAEIARRWNAYPALLAFVERVTRHDERIEGEQATRVLRGDIDVARSLLAKIGGDEKNQRHSDGGRCCECDSPDHECDECPVFD